MTARRTTQTALLALALALAGALAPRPVAADIITLSSGRTIEGTVVGEDDENIHVQTKTGIQYLPRETVRKVEKIADPKTEFAKRKKALEADRAARGKHWFDLGQWAEEVKLEAEAKQAYEKAIAVEPDHVGARRKLGYEKIGKDWLPYAEAQKRKGFVLHEGRWVRPEEKEKLEQGFVLDADGQWVHRSVIEERKRAEEERKRKAEEYARERERIEREKERQRAELEGGSAAGGAVAGGGEPGAGARPLPPQGEGEPPSPELIARLLENQKAEARATEQLLGLKFEDVEEGPLLIHTTHPKDSQKLRDFLKNLGKIYQVETKIYNLPFDAPIWPGKLQIYFFADKSQFDAFATRIDNAPGAVQSGGYFIHGGGTDGYSKLHIAMYDLELGTLAHEVSHAFMSRYQYSERVVIPWVNEGVAEFLRIYVGEQLELGGRDYRHRGMVKEMLARNDARVSLQAMMAKEDIAGTEGWAYAISYTIVDFMVAADKGKFVRFLKALKKGGDGSFKDRWAGAGPAEQTRAIEEAYGIPIDKFEQGWKDYVRAYK